MNQSQTFIPDFQSFIPTFINLIGSNTIEIYNEFSLQHELGIILRSQLPTGWKLQFERHISYFGIQPQNCLKREIDIVVYEPSQHLKFAFELKFPTNGQYPEQMFKCCQDICFLEQLVANGFSGGYFLILADDHNFFEGDMPSPIYPYFRAGKPIHGLIQKPTGDKCMSTIINGTYTISWKPLKHNMKYAFIVLQAEINSDVSTE
jgi:hypothetical protein